ncbi:pyrophosphorylase [Methyloceanibacter methanicus]|uniref:Putative pyrophosphorylase ModD n=1 Tax=Methyloceanibacter methanicus TaxID=1774968 RepID=A0A1E3VWK1_9HYPH|nr:ModD protein [Methyloceanibacter methanicus]ODR97910.1 pyrophosphorylase [Methyloceanibacter methanicus]
MTAFAPRPVLSPEAHWALLADDAPHGDLTTESLGIGEAAGKIRFAARQDMTVAGLEDAAALLSLAGVAVSPTTRSGDRAAPGTVLLEGEGPASALHRAWKVSQTFLEIWSGVATGAQALTDAARAVRPDAIVACTRKNVPGTKRMAAAAVHAGGAVMHRLGLSETLLVFPEHRAFLPDEDLALLAKRLKVAAPEKKCVIEVLSVDEGIAAARAGFDVIQTEKFRPGDVGELARCLDTVAPRPILAAAGGITPENAGDYVHAGADVLVSSWPYTARPADIAVAIEPSGS